jgi:hypothetical protein
VKRVIARITPVDIEASRIRRLYRPDPASMKMLDAGIVRFARHYGPLLTANEFGLCLATARELSRETTEDAA